MKENYTICPINDIKQIKIYIIFIYFFHVLNSAHAPNSKSFILFECMHCVWVLYSVCGNKNRQINI